MNKKRYDANLYLLAGFLFLAAGIMQDALTFYVIACCMFVLSIQNRRKKK